MGLTRLQASTITDSDFKTSCKVATTTDIANLTTGAPNSVDGVNLSVGDRILVKAQSNPAENGIYTVASVGTGSNGRWSRATDFRDNVSISSGSITFVENGTNANTFYYLAGGIGSITVGSTSLTFKSFALAPPGSNTQVLFNNNGEFGASSSLTWNGSNLAITGNILANGFYFSNGSPFTVDSTQILNGNSNVKVAANSNVTVSVTGTANVLTITATGANISGTANITGNVNVGNIGGTTAVFTNLTGTLTTAAQPNITSVGTLSSLVVSGNANVGNILAGGFYFSNGSPFTVDTTQILNGNSNVAVAANSNVTVSVAGNANILTLTGTGANISGTANITGNTYVGNIFSTGFYFANGSPFTVDTTQILNGNSNVSVSANSNVTVSVAGNANVFTVTGTGANVSGTLGVTGNISVGNLLATGVFFSNGQPYSRYFASSSAPVSPTNGDLWYDTDDAVLYVRIGDGSFSAWLDISSSTNIFNDITANTANITTTLTVGANANVGNLNTTGDIQIGGNDIKSSTGNIAITLNDKDVTVIGNLAVQGATTTIGSQNYTVQDSIIDLHTFSNLAPLTADDGRDIGIRMHYFKSTTDKHAFLGWANDTGFLEYYSEATESSGVVSGTYGTIKVANVFANSGVFYNGTSNLTVTASGNVTVSVSGNANVVTVTGTGANISGTLNATGNANVGNLGAATVVATNLTGTLTTAAQPNITSVGTLTSLSVTGNANTGNLGTGTVIATTANLTTVNSGLVQNGNSNVTITANSNVSVFVNGNATARAVFTSTGANVAGTLDVTGNVTVSNITANGISNLGAVANVRITGGSANQFLKTDGAGNLSFGSAGVNFTASTTAPTSPNTGDQWYDTAADILFTRINDGSGDLWLDISSTGNTFNALTANTITVNSNANITGPLTVRGYTGGTVGSAIATYTKNLVIGGVYNQAYNSGNAAMLHIADYSNDPGDNVYPIYVEDENNVVDFYLYAGTDGTTGTKKAYFGGNVGIGNTAPAHKLTVAGNVVPSANASFTLGTSALRWSNIWGLASSAQYADLAEKYLADESYSPATVVIFGGKAEITVTTQSHDSRVAGVISTEPAYLMNDNEHQGNLWLPVALTGRVPCKVQGPVRKGDVLVASSTAGVAEKLDKAQYEPGCVIGKSLENHMENTIKTIEVVVGRF